jgi:hypothetical protein
MKIKRNKINLKKKGDFDFKEIFSLRILKNKKVFFLC